MKTIIRQYASLATFCILVLTICGCSKKDDGTPQSNVKAMVSEFYWYSFKFDNGLKLYQAKVEHELINKANLDGAQVLVYASRVDMIHTDNRTFFKLPYSSGTRKISSSVKGGQLTLTSNFKIFTDIEDHYFCFIILPKGFILPKNLDLNNFDQVAAYFKIKKTFNLVA